MAMIGDVLKQAEEGWVRIDSADNAITYAGPWQYVYNLDCYNTTRVYTSQATSCNIKFNFKGTGIRIIGTPDSGSLNIRVTIDGKSDGFAPLKIEPQSQWQTLMYEKTGLSANTHNCVIDYDCPWAQFDAVDIRIPQQHHIVYLKENAAYGSKSSVLTKLTDDWTVLTAVEKKALFEATNYEIASADDLAALGKFKVISYTETENTPEIKLKIVPKDQLVFPRGLTRIESYDSINQMALTKALSGNGFCKLLVTDDMKMYQTFDFDASEWKVVDHTDLAAVKSTGINAEKLADIDRAAWDKLIKGKSGIGFAYLMGIDAIADQCAIDQLTLQANMKGTWK